MSKIIDSLPSTEPGTPNPELAGTDRELANDDPEKAAPAASLAASVPSPPPDGGLQAWLAVLGGFCMVFASFGWINCTYYPQKLYVDGLKLIPTRHRYLPGLLPDSPTLKLLFKYRSMDTSNRIVLHVLLRTYHITVIVRNHL
jgi:hypothetical protein